MLQPRPIRQLLQAKRKLDRFQRARTSAAPGSSSVSLYEFDEGEPRAKSGRPRVQLWRRRERERERERIALLEREKEAVESQTKRSASQSPTRVSLEKYQQLESDLEAAKSKEASLNIKISELETSLVAATTAVIPTSDNTADLLEKLAAKDEQLESVHSQLQLLQGDFQLVQAERSQYLKELEQKSELIGSLQSQVDQLTKGVEAGKDVLTRVEASDSLVKQLQEEKDSLVSRIRTLESSASEPKTSTFTEDLETKLINLEKDLLESRSENQKLQEQIDQLQWDQEWPTLNVAASPKSKTPPNSAISPSFPTTTTTPSNAELDSLKSEITHLKTEIETLSREAEQERIRSHDLQTSLTHFKSTALEVAQLQQEIMDLQQLKETEANRFVEQSTRLENEIRELQREKVDDLEEVVRSVRNSPTGANAPGGVVAGEEVVRVKKELEELRVLYENDSQRLETEVLELKKYLKASEEDNVELRERQQFVFPRVETPEELKLKGEVEAARQLHKQVVLRLEQELVDLRKYLKASEEDNAELRNSLEKTERGIGSVASASAGAVCFPTTVSCQQQPRRRSYAAEINELKKYLKASEEDNMELREKLELLEEQLEAQPNAVPPVAVPRSITPQPQPTTNTEEWDSWDSEIVPQSANTDVQISDLNRQIDVLSQDKIRPRETNCSSGRAVRAVHIERDSLLQKIATVQADVKALQSLVEEARKERDAALLEAVMDVQAKLGVAVSERDAALAERTRVREELDRLKEEVSFKATQSVDLEVLLTLQKEYDSLKNQVARAKEELEIRVEDMRCDAIDLLGEQELLTAQHSDLNAQNQSLVAAAEEMHARHQDLVARYDDLSNRFENLSAQNHHIREAQELNTLREAGAKILEDRQALEEEADAFAAQVDDLTAQLASFTEEKAVLENQIAELRNELDNSQHVLQEAESRASRFEQLYREIEAKSTNDTAELKSAQLIELEEQVKNLHSTTFESMQQIDMERGQLADQLQDVTGQNVTLTEKCNVLRESTQSADPEEVEFLRQQLVEASFNTERGQLQYEIDFLKERFMHEEAQGRLQLIESDLAGGDELEQTRAERNALSEECSMLKVQMDEYAAEKESLTAAAVELDTLRGVGELERERTHVAEQYQHLQGAIDESQTRCVGLERQLDETNALYEQLQQQLDSTSRDSAYYQQQVSDLQAAVAALEQERDAVLGEHNVNQSSGLSESEREEIRSQYESKLTDLENQIQLMHQQHEADIQIRMEQFSNTYAQYQSEKQEEFLFWKNAEQADKEARNASLQLEESTKYVTELQLRFDDVEAQATRSETACRDLEMAVAQLKAERDEIQEKFLDGANMLETLKNDLESSDARTNALLAEKDSAIYNLQNALDESYRVSAEKESYFEHERQSLSGRCDEAESQWKSLQAQLEGMMAQYSESQQAIDSISFQLKEAAIKLEASEQERLLISGERDSLDRQLTEFREIEAAQRVELEELHSRISQSDERIKTLEQLVDSLESQRAQFNSVINNETSLVQDIAHKQQIIENLERELFQLKSLNASPNPVFAGIPTADSLFAGSTGGRVTVEHELALLKIEVRNKEDELASVHSSYKTALAELEEKLNSLAKLNKSSVQSMELYRDELVKKSDRLDVVEEELFRLKSTIPGSIKETPDTSMLDISKYEEAIDRAGKTSKTLDELLSATSQRGTRSVPVFGPIEKAEILDVLTSQISTLIRSTETNVSISRKILNEVSVSSPRGIVPSSSVPRTDDGQIKLIVQSQSSILDDHKRLLNDVEVLARLFKESGSSKKSTGEDLSVETLSLVSKFIAKVEEYQQSVNGFALTKQAVLEDIRGNGLEDVASQNNLLKKEISYLGSLVNKVKQAPSKPDAGNDYHLSSREYGELVTKANQSERYQLQVENAQTLLAEHVREIQILKQAVDALNLKLARETGSVGVSDVQTFRIMTQQIDELKKVWSHELSANMILRNLIAKTQAENMVAEQESRKQNLSLREEFDELAVLFEESQAENDLLRSEVEKKEELVRNAEVRAEEQFNSRFFEMEQQHIEQNQQLEDMYDKERVALNKLSCDTLRQENSSLKSRNLDNRDLGRREQELVADVQALERQLHEERKVHERRMMDREAEWQRIREEDLRRRGNSNMEDALRVFRSEKEHLEHDLMLRNNQIHTLEVRIQELLQEAESPRRPGGSRREMEMERDLQASFSQIARRELESQLTLEKDRSKRLSVKADDLKRRYQYQQRLLEDQEESINSALRPAPRGGTAEDQLHDEIAQLRRELHSAKQSRSEIINIIRDTLVNTVGEASIDAAPASATSASSMIVRQSQRIDMTRLRNQMSSLIAEVIYLRALASRLFLWRADLKYQKVYLALKVADLTESQKATVKFITEMGVDAPQRDLDAPVLRPLQKLRAGVNVVIGVYRMMVNGARMWQDTLEENNRDYLPIVPSTIQDIDDDGILTDILCQTLHM
ncbi:hypothetical protein BCR33DRAFT_797732, partial [Rhizoclosmatium globosum]